MDRSNASPKLSSQQLSDSVLDKVWSAPLGVDKSSSRN